MIAIPNERKHYLSSLPANTRVIGYSVRSHRGIENNSHWVKDLTFHENYTRNRKDQSAANVATMRRFELNLTKQDKTAKGSIKVRHKRAEWKGDYLLSLLEVSS